MRAQRGIWVMIFAFFILANGARAQKINPCSEQEYKVLNAAAVGIRCLDDVSTLGIVSASGKLFATGNPDTSQPKADITVVRFTSEASWLLLMLSGPDGPLQPGKKYSLLITYVVKCTGAACQGPTSVLAPVSVEIDTTETVKISPSVVDSRPKSFKVASTIGFSKSPGSLSYLHRVNLKASEVPCEINVRAVSSGPAALPGVCSELSEETSIASAALANIDPEDVGVYDLSFRDPVIQTLIPGPLPFKSIFGTSLKVDPKSRFSPKKAPATKDASQYYINVNYSAGVGTAPAWVLDGQITPRLWMTHGFTISPLAAADVGNNKLSGQTYTNTIDFGIASQKPFFTTNLGPLREALLVTGFKYETDKQFDRDNLLGTADLRYSFARLYRTQDVQTLATYYEALQQYRNKKTSGDPNQTPYVPQVDDFRPPLIGYALDFHTGIETGGALLDTTVNASSGKATQTLPSYSILRLVPQVHGLLEIWKFKLESTFAGRYLALTENTVLETSAHALILTQVRGWKGLETVNGTYTFDAQGHFGVTIALKDGFAPPTYKRVNAVQAGLLIKY
jgi:hypothetical protein